MNELASFDLMDIDTNEVIDAASTKWNFLKFRPGIVEVIVLVLIHII